MASVKWGLDASLDYQTALRLLDSVDPKKGRGLNWGGLRLFIGEPDDEGDPIPVVKKGCVELVKIRHQSVTLNCGHWRSNLALKVFSLFSPLRLGVKDQNWFLIRGNVCPLLFVDGIRIHKNLRVSPAIAWNVQRFPDPAESVWPIFERYIESFVASIGRGEVKPPTAEGCWTCYYNTTAEVEGSPVPKGSEPGGVGHLFAHVTEKEEEPSLLWRALQEGNLNPHMRWGNVVGTNFYSSDLHACRDYLTSFFRRRLGMLGAFHMRAAHLLKQKKANSTSDDQDSGRREGQTGGLGNQTHGHAVQPGATVPGV